MTTTAPHSVNNPAPAPSRRLRLPRGTPRFWELGRKHGQQKGDVRQVVVARELIWRPALSGIGYAWLQTAPEGLDTSIDIGRAHRTYLRNAGGSPAIDARFVYRRVASVWFMSTPVDIPSQGAQVEVIGGQQVDERMAHTLLGSIGATEALAGAIFCRDFLRRMWCFPIPEIDDSATLEPIPWRKGSRAPAWASSPELWGPHAA